MQQRTAPTKKKRMQDIEQKEGKKLKNKNEAIIKKKLGPLATRFSHDITL